jgi:hypothetical protein
MRSRLFRFAAALLATASLFGAGCRRGVEPARPAAPPPASGALDTPEARQARERRAEAVAGVAAQPGVAAERCRVLLDPDFGAPQAGTLEEGAPVEVLLVEPGFFGIRTADGGLAFVPARSVHLLPGVLGTPSAMSRPRHEIVPQIVPLTPEAETPAPGTHTPAAAVSPTAGAAR